MQKEFAILGIEANHVGGQHIDREVRRELRNVLERSTIMCEKDMITRSCLPDEFGKSQAKGPSDLSSIRFPVGTTVDAMERELILQTLNATGNNKTRAADLLGISLKTLHNKLKEYGGERAETV